MKKKILKYVAVISAVLCAVLIFSFLSLGASSFEKQISAFPESYRIHLRELHKKYPNWTFTPIKTGLDWYDAVENENDAERSAVPKAASRLCKNQSKGYYDASTGEYKQTDAGWNDASPDTVAFFLDPRNFLTEEDIFQFELLSFSSDIKVSDVEQILKGTFMYDTNITYYDTKGNLKKTTTKYSQCIYDAGKNNDVNPCFLASKIKNEVVSGGGPSGSVSGKYSGYAGYYNFYNIGAYAGSSPIKNGLIYASASGTYGRPWNTPQKSINGGAQFLAESYIARGQNTGYFQKFNVSPYATSAVYNHQYMSNVSGAQSQGRSTYNSYLSQGLLSLSRTFAIPVYDNMPGADEQMKNFTLFDTYNQTANPTTTLNVRTEPNTSGKFVVSVRKETKVTVLSKCRTNMSGYYQNLYYPYWYYISFTQDGKSYKGYAVADYLTLNTCLRLNKGSTITLPAKSLGSEKPTLYTWDTSIISISSDFKVKGLKNGTAYITATTSSGGYDYIKIKVGSYTNTSLGVKNFAWEPDENGVRFSWSKPGSITGYELAVFDGSKCVASADIVSSKTSYTVGSLEGGKSYSAQIRAFKVSSGEKLNGSYASLKNISALPEKVKGLICDDVTVSSFTLSWNKTPDAAGYQILKLNTENGKYEAVKTVTETKAVFSSQKAGYSGDYKVRAYFNVSGKKIYGEESDSTEGYTYVSLMADLKKVTAKKTSVSVSWTAVKNAALYRLYRLNESKGKYEKCGETEKTSYTFSSLAGNNIYSVKVEALSSASKKLSAGEYEIKTLPNKVTGLKQTSSTGYKIKLSWDKSKTADSYQIYVLNKSDGKYTLKAKTAKTSTTLTGFTVLSEESFKVRAVVDNYGVESYGDYSSVIKGYTGPKKPTDIKIKSLSSTGVSLTWSKKKGAGGYNCYMLDEKTGKYILLGSVTSTSCNISSLVASHSYTFLIESFRNVGSKKITGSRSTDFKLTTAPSKIKNISVTDNKINAYTLTWKKSDKADGYYVYLYNSSKKKYELVRDTEENKAVFTGLYSAKKASYTVCGYVIENGKKYAGVISDSADVSTLPKNPSTFSAKKQTDGSYKLSWTNAKRVSGCRISVYNASSKKWLLVGETTKTTYSVPASKMKNITKIKIQSFVRTGGSDYLSSGKAVTV